MSLSFSLDLEKVQRHRRLASKERHEHLDLALFLIDFVHRPTEITKRPVNDPDGIAQTPAKP